MFNRNKRNKLKRQQYSEKILRENKQEETTKIDINSFNISKSEYDLSYERYSSLPTKELKSRLEHELLTNQEKEIIKRIIDARK